MAKGNKMIRNTILLITLLCVFINVTDAQNYYPADVGNTWVLESEDGAERVTYVIEAADESVDGEEVRILKLTTEVLGTSTINTNTFHVQVAEKGMKLRRIIAELGDIFGVARVDFSPPVIFFPETLQLGEVWETRGETEVGLVGAVTISSVNEVIDIEDVDTPAGMFKNCFKIRMRTKTAAAIGTSRSTTYQWLAPDLGPVKFETDQDIVFELVSSNLLAPEMPYDVNDDGVVNILDLVFVASHFGASDPKADVNADGTVNILDLTLVAQNFRH